VGLGGVAGAPGGWLPGLLRSMATWPGSVASVDMSTTYQLQPYMGATAPRVLRLDTAGLAAVLTGRTLGCPEGAAVLGDLGERGELLLVNHHH